MKPIRKTLISAGALIIGLMLAAQPVMAGSFEDGLAAAERKDYATSLRLWHPLAEQGNARAQLFLGLLYHNGHGVPQDYAEAAKWYRKAANQGFAEAQIILGSLYMSGLGVSHDHAEAVRWYRKAAEQGHKRAKEILEAFDMSDSSREKLLKLTKKYMQRKPKHEKEGSVNTSQRRFILID